MAIEYKGNKCLICGYAKYQGALDLHHIDPAQKDFSLGHKGYTRSWEKIKAELDKCVLLCATCHREVEGGVLQNSPYKFEMRSIAIERLCDKIPKAIGFVPMVYSPVAQW